MSALLGWARPWLCLWLVAAAALLLLLDTANATIVSTCGSAALNLTVGQEVSTQWNCPMPGDVGCAKVVTSFPVTSYANQPLIARFSEVWAAGLTSVELKYTFRGFDNAFDDDPDSDSGEREVNVAKRIVCSSENSTEDMEEELVVFFNITVLVIGASPRSLPWVPPANVDVPCLVVGEETLIELEFTQTPDAVGAYRPLQGGWTRDSKEEPPWVFSRPAPADTVESTSVLQRIDSGPGNGTLTLAFKALPGTEGIVERRQCIYPGDGYNYYEQLCTEPFPVRVSRDSCNRADVIMGQVDGGSLGTAPHMLIPGISAVIISFVS